MNEKQRASKNVDTYVSHTNCVNIGKICVHYVPHRISLSCIFYLSKYVSCAIKEKHMYEGININFFANIISNQHFSTLFRSAKPALFEIAKVQVFHRQFTCSLIKIVLKNAITCKQYDSKPLKNTFPKRICVESVHYTLLVYHFHIILLLFMTFSK